MVSKEDWFNLVNSYIFNKYGPGKEKYWDPKIETMPRKELDRIREIKFRALVKYLYENSPFYHRKFDQARLKPDDFKSIQDIRKGPITVKEDFAISEKENPPFGDFHCLTMDEWKKEGFIVFSTGGTTAKPRLFMVSLKDKDTWSYLYARALWAFNIRPGDILFNTSVYGPFPGMWGAHYGAHLIGCPIIPGGGMDSRRRMFFIKELKATVLIGIPSYVLHLAEEARKMGIDPAKDTEIKHVVLMAEPGACVPSTKNRIENDWSAITHDYFGHTEAFMGGALGYSCYEEDLHHDRPVNDHISEDMAIVEVVDPNTFDPVEKEEKGVTVVTNLMSVTYPAFRYVMGDLMRYTDDLCECGRTFGRALGGLLGRVDDMLKIKGTVIYPSAIEDVLRSFKELGNEYEVIITKINELDDILIRAEINPNVTKENLDDVKEKLERDLYITLGVKTKVELLPYGTLPRYTRGDLDAKAKRIKDLRLKVLG